MRRATVEQCLTVDLAHLERYGLSPGKGYPYSWTFRGQRSASIRVCVIDNGWLTFEYLAGHDAITDDIYLERVEGTGYRVYFLCPGCNQRVRTLHQPPGGSFFRCRKCHSLVYQSQLEHRTILDRYLIALRSKHGTRRGARLTARDFQALMAFRLSGDFSAVEPSLGRFQRVTSQHRWRWSRPGRPSKKAIRARDRWRRMNERGLIGAFGKPIEQPKRRPGRPREKRAYHRKNPVKHTLGPGEAFCVKCKAPRPLVRAHEVTLSNGRPALKGHCKDCGTRLCRMLPTGPR